MTLNQCLTLTWGFFETAKDVKGELEDVGIAGLHGYDGNAVDGPGRTEGDDTISGHREVLVHTLVLIISLLKHHQDVDIGHVTEHLDALHLCYNRQVGLV